jgi:hypothetical protein
MGFFDFLPWVGDDKPAAAAPKPAPAATSATAGQPPIRKVSWDAPMALQNLVDTKQKAVPEWAKLDPKKYDPTKAKELSEYTYDLTGDEWSKLQELYQRDNPGAPALDQALQAGAKQLRTAPMTEDAYQALSDDQKGAVNFNTLLAEAREKDLMSKGNAVGDTKTEYDSSVAEMFGEGGGSEKYAPNTIKLLKDLNFKAQGQDLDSFLSMDAGVSLEELKDFKLSDQALSKMQELEDYKRADEPGPRSTTTAMGFNFGGMDILGFLRPDAPPKPMEFGALSADQFAELRSNTNQQAAFASAIAAAGEKIAAGMDASNIPAWSLDAAFKRGTGQELTGADVPLGWSTDLPRDRPGQGEATVEGVYQKAWNYLADANNKTLDEFWLGLNGPDVSEEQLDELFKYVNQRTYAEDEQGKPGEGQRSGAEIREFLNMGGK